MSEFDRTSAHIEAPPEVRRRGAPHGNHNALKHGRYSAAAKRARMEPRERLARKLAAATALVQKQEGAKRGGIPPSNILPNKRINSGPSSPKKRGAPTGNTNAVKHGREIRFHAGCPPAHAVRHRQDEGVD